MEQTPPSFPFPGPLCLLTDGHAGNLRQAHALADALRPPPHTSVCVFPPAPWRWVAPHHWPGAAAALGAGFAAVLAQPPALAIGCGRQAALATRLLRKRGTPVVQILDPRCDPAHWDWVIAPAHDAVKGRNVFSVQGSLTPVDDVWLAQARQAFTALAALPAPRTAVLLGGSSAHFRFDRAAFEPLAARLHALRAEEGGSVLITTSRRTAPEIGAAVQQHFAHTPGLIWRDDRDGINPYPGLLAWADRIVCSADSVNMISEACATALPVFVHHPQHVNGRPRRFLDALLAHGRIRALTDAPLISFDVQPLRETVRAAQWLRERWGEPVGGTPLSPS